MQPSGSSPTGGGSGVTTNRVWSNDAHNKVEIVDLAAKFNDGIGKQQGINVEYTVYGADWDQA
ncbi:MAG: hypothetical protein LBT16_01130, partial [Treponema sp.]|nr:hypothetical protein [Treponema sp.]